MTGLETFRCVHMRFAEYCKISHLLHGAQETIARGNREIAEALERWSHAFESMLTGSPRLNAAMFHQNVPEMLLLRIHQAISKIGLHLTETHVRPSVDVFAREFRAITHYAARFMIKSTPGLQRLPGQTNSVPTAVSRRTHGSDDTLHCSHIKESEDAKKPKLEPAIHPSFSMGLGIIMPLFVVCIHCKDYQVRREALHLLKICNRKEGLWDSYLAARTCEVLIAAEEQEALRLLCKPGQPLLDTFPHNGRIPEQVRIRELWAEFVPGQQAIITYSQGGVDHSWVV